MQDLVTPADPSELAAAFLQGAVTVGLAGLCTYLYLRYRKPHFAFWAVAWGVYGLRIGAIVTFMFTTSPIWLYWHQVTTGWSALGFLWAALVFAQRIHWKPHYALFVLFPVAWSYFAIYRLENFLLAAAPAVAFLSGATAWTGWTFLQHQRHLRSGAAGLLAVTLFLWSLHHLDYPFLRARGAWNPWGYYLDILFALAVGVGILLLVLEDVRGGLNTLSELSGQLHLRAEPANVVSRLLESTLELGGVRGSAMFVLSDNRGTFTAGTGTCKDWIGQPADHATEEIIRDAIQLGKPQVLRGPKRPAEYVAAMPIAPHLEVTHVMVIVGDARDPFAALDERFLLTLSQQVGAAIDNAELHTKLVARTNDLERLARKMVRQHEDERQRLSRELHDETAQVFSALKFQLGALQESDADARADHIDRSLGLVDLGIKSIRAVTRALRPPILDDLGVTPALEALSEDVRRSSGLSIELATPASLPKMSPERELALFRALQEGYSNVLKHADATMVHVSLTTQNGDVVLEVLDDGTGPPPESNGSQLERQGHLGLPGMRERIHGLGGSVFFGPATGQGACLRVRLPASDGDSE